MRIRPLRYPAIMLLSSVVIVGQAGAIAPVDIHRQWSVCQYHTLASQKAPCFSELSQTAQAQASQHPGKADYLIWSAMVDSSLAGVKEGREALSLAKQAKNSLEKALALDPQALDGSAYTILGVLYYQVPGWPLGFGNEEKAETYLKTALTINPNSIDANYFYGDFLLKSGRKTEAKTYLNAALRAPARSGRELADQGRRMQAEQALRLLQ